MVKIFSEEFTNLVKQLFICSWRSHKKGKWKEVWWAPAHSTGYQSRFCEVCHKELESTKQDTLDLAGKFKPSSKKPLSKARELMERKYSRQ